MVCLVIGSGGFIGSFFVRKLRADGVNVIESSSKLDAGIDKNSGLFSEEFRIPKTTDSVIYVAQSPYFRDVPSRALHVAAVNTYSVICAASEARRAGVRKFIYLSTGSVYASSFEPISESFRLRRDDWYSLSKAHAEEALSLFRDCMQIVIVRPFGVYGPGQKDRLVPNLIRAVSDGSPVALQARVDGVEDHQGLRLSLCYIDDFVVALSMLVHSDFAGVVNVASEEVLSIRSIVDEVAERLGASPNYVVSSNKRSSDFIADTALLQRTFNVRFRSFSQGIKETLDAVR